MERLSKIANRRKLLTIFEKRSILNVWRGSEWAYDNDQFWNRKFVGKFHSLFIFYSAYIVT